MLPSPPVACYTPPGSHRDVIVDQFTQQAEPYAAAPGIRDGRALALLVACTGAGPDDTVLDVACGPGHVACAFARVARHVTGTDVTPAMIDRARALAAADDLRNVAWVRGEALPLPYRDHTFSVVVSRFAFHHLPDPATVLGEMRRVCRPGGRVAVADVTPPPEKAAAFDRMERLRDPSHVRALPLAELRALVAAAGLAAPQEAFYRLESDLDGVLVRSFPDPRDVGTIRRLFAASLADDALGLEVRRVGEAIRFSYPVTILTAARTAPRC